MEMSVEIGSITNGKGSPLALIAGPCVIETPEILDVLKVPTFLCRQTEFLEKIKAIRSAL